jgi:hypothetical protein
MGTTVDDCVEGFKALCTSRAARLDSFQAPSALDELVYNSLLNAPDRRQLKIGILQESSHLPYSDSVKRAIAITEKALVNLGFTLVPFFLTQDVWDSAREFSQCLKTNCLHDQLLELLTESGEKPIGEIEQLMNDAKRGSLSHLLNQTWLKITGQRRA